MGRRLRWTIATIFALATGVLSTAFAAPGTPTQTIPTPDPDGQFCVSTYARDDGPFSEEILEEIRETEEESGLPVVVERAVDRACFSTHEELKDYERATNTRGIEEPSNEIGIETIGGGYYYLGTLYENSYYNQYSSGRLEDIRSDSMCSGQIKCFLG